MTELKNEIEAKKVRVRNVFWDNPCCVLTPEPPAGLLSLFQPHTEDQKLVSAFKNFETESLKLYKVHLFKLLL